MQLPSLRRLAAIPLLPLLLSACGHLQPAAEPVVGRLTLGERIVRTAGPGEQHRYRIDTEEARFVQFAVRQQGVDVSLRLRSSSGEDLAASDGPATTHGFEILAAVLPRAGTYDLLITTEQVDPDSRPPEYSLRWLRSRPPRPGDPVRAQAMMLYGNGRQLVGPDASRDDHRQALEYLESASELAARIGDTTILAWSMLRRVSAHQALEQFQTAKELGDDILELADNLDPGTRLQVRAEAHGNLALAYEALDEPASALSSYDAALEAYRELDDPRGLAHTFGNRGDLYYSMGMVDEARADFERSLEIREGLASSDPANLRSRLTVMINLGAAYRQLGQPEQALERYEQAAVLARQTGWRSDDLHLLSNLSAFHLALGELDKASQTVSTGIELARRLEDNRAERAMLGYKGLLHRLLGEVDAAIETHRAALDLSIEVGRDTWVAAASFDLGDDYLATGDSRRALQIYEQGLDSALSSQSTSLEVRGLRSMASALTASGRPSQALAAVDRAFAVYPDAPLPVRTELLLTRAEAERELGRSASARNSLLAAVDLDLASYDPLAYGVAHARLARVLRDLGRLGEARQSLDTALRVYEDLRSHLAYPDVRMHFTAQWRDVYVEMTDLLMTLDEEEPSGGHAREAVAVSERARARTLADLLSEARVEIRDDLDPDLAEREQALRTRLSLLHSELLDKLGHGDASELESLRESIDTTRARYRRLEWEIRDRHAEYAALKYPEPLDLAGIQGLLPEGATLLEYVLGEERSFLFVVRNDTFLHRELPAAPVLEELIHAFRRAQEAVGPRSGKQLAEVNRHLYETLIEPVEGELEGSARLWIVPDRQLFYLPFEALRRPDGYLVERWAVTYVPSASVLKSLKSRQRPRTSGSFVAFARPLSPSTPGSERARGEPEASTGTQGLESLAGTEREVRRIASMMPSGSRLYLDEDAHQGNVFGNPAVRRARWLHFATHGLVEEDEPYDSALYLSPDPAGDRLLQVFEIFDLELSADLVVLSACETALGRLVHGEGLVGLSRAFFYAGTRSVVVSLWPVNDEATAELMYFFYADLLDGLRPGEALRRAKISMMETTPYAHPRFWASFVLLGDSEWGNAREDEHAYTRRDV